MKDNKASLTSAIETIKRLRHIDQERRSIKALEPTASGLDEQSILDRLISERELYVGHVTSIERKAIKKYVERKLVEPDKVTEGAIDLMLAYVRTASKVNLCSSMGIFVPSDSPLKEILKVMPYLVTPDPSCDDESQIELCKGVETSIAIGAIKAELDFDKNDAIVCWILDDGKWRSTQLSCNVDEIKACIYDAQKEVAQFCKDEVFTDDALSAISMGDLFIVSLMNGMISATWRDEHGHDEAKTFSDIEEINDLCNGYCDRVGVVYNHADSTVSLVTRALAKREVHLKDGRLVCAICGQDLNDDAVQSSNPSAATTLSRKIQYKANYKAWEKLDAAVKLTKASLEAYGNKPLTHKLLDGLVDNVQRLISDDKVVADKFVNKLLALSATSTMNKDNVSILVKEIRENYGISDSSSVCPACGQPKIHKRVARDVSPRAADTTDARIEKGTTFKGVIDREPWGQTIAKDAPYAAVGGTAELFKDGTQQAFNPFIDPAGTWTKFSYRPQDAKEGYPWISIIPASFHSILSIENIMDNVPYVLVSEYFMRNNVSSAINLFQGALKGAADQPDSAEASTPAEIKAHATELIDTVKNLFAELADPNAQVLYAPFILYHRMKAKLYGNRYVFPYNPKDNAITSSSNTEEWGGEGGILQTLTSGIMGLSNSIVGALGIGIAKPFPAPTWKLPESGTKWQFSFDLNFLNDEFIRSRCNYMCANTIINNNRWIQKTIFGFPGALYEIMVPTGVRELMCTGSFTLKPLGVNRHVPNDFFNKPFEIGSIVYGSPKYPLHSGNYEVIPDAYALNCQFQSCITENLNNSIFGYYLEIAEFPPGTQVNSALEAMMAAGPGFILPDVAMAKPVDTTEKDKQTANSVIQAISPEMAQKIAEDEKAREQGKGPAERGFDAAVKAYEQQYGPFDPNKPPPVDSWYWTSSGRKQDEDRLAQWNQVKDKYDLAQAEKAKKPPSKSARQSTTAHDPFRWDGTMEIYSTRYEALRKRVMSLKYDMVQKRTMLENLVVKMDDLPLNMIRRAYSKKIVKLKGELKYLMDEINVVEDEMIELEMKILLHGQDVVKERASSAKVAVPRGYFDLPELDPVTELKIRMMTDEERQRYRQELELQFSTWDIWGIHKCKDFLIRYGVLRFIAEMMNNLVELMKDVEETDQALYDEYKYRHSMLKEDLNAVLDASKPFVFNKTNIVYIDKSNLPQDQYEPVEPVIAPEDEHSDAETTEPEQPSTEIVPVDDSSDVAIIDVDGVEVFDREALIEQHRAEVVKQVFGDEEGLAAAAFNEVTKRTAPNNDKRVLIVLKHSPELDDVQDMKSWFAQQASSLTNPDKDMYQEIYERMKDDADDGVKIELSNNATRKDAIRAITQDLYRYVSAQRVVLINNAMNEVDTKARQVLNRMTNKFHRLEN